MRLKTNQDGLLKARPGKYGMDVIGTSRLCTAATATTIAVVLTSL